MRPLSSYDQVRNARVRLTCLCFSPPHTLQTHFRIQISTRAEEINLLQHTSRLHRRRCRSSATYSTPSRPSNPTRDFSVGLDAEVVPQTGTRLRADSDTHVPVLVFARRAPRPSRISVLYRYTLRVPGYSSVLDHLVFVRGRTLQFVSNHL